MDTVFLHGLKAQTLIGVFDWERRRPQTVLLDIDIRTDLRAAEASDDVADTVSYAEAAELVVSSLAGQQFFLLEALAGYTAQLLLDRFAACESVRVKAVKPGILPGVAQVGVVVERGRG
ncbi:dihydroneopterin aldolase [Eikenella sp. S3360]|uniref:dihydroneopterin aldolase n=1 Tax=Eikenella glucosivorans TaxID=2766967 RepID=A0ABS0NCH7_9NEIS|nr:dihydroneopterin aldolase [Eikenella glucosivorans]MBH5330001.1 dihydroneopterin aldolase [Eikenella glucosivorans]